MVCFVHCEGSLESQVVKGYIELSNLINIPTAFSPPYNTSAYILTSRSEGFLNLKPLLVLTLNTLIPGMLSGGVWENGLFCQYIDVDRDFRSDHSGYEKEAPTSNWYRVLIFSLASSTT